MTDINYRIVPGDGYFLVEAYKPIGKSNNIKAGWIKVTESIDVKDLRDYMLKAMEILLKELAK